MGLGAEAFTILAILEARDKASEAFAKVDEALGKFGDIVKETADTAKGSSDEIDESLATTASGADAVELATAKVAAAQERLAAASQSQAEAEQRLMQVTSQGVASDEDLARAAEDTAVAQGRAAEAQKAVTEAARAQMEALVALSGELGDGADAAGLYFDANERLRNSQGQFVSGADAQEIALTAVTEAEGDGTEAASALAAANERLAEAQRASGAAATDASAAQAKQDALLSRNDVAAAGQNLAKADKAAQSASTDLSAAQAKQVSVQKAVIASTDEAKAAAVEQAAAAKQAAQDSEDAANFLGKAGKIAGITALGMGVAGALMVKAAGNFQNSTVHLMTDAGVTKANLGMVQSQILQISSATGTAASDVTNAMYHIASGGLTGADGIDVLKVATEGAKVGGADLDTVSKTLVGTMNAYYGSTTNASNATSRSTSMMEEMIGTVSTGDMRMQDLASSLSTVAPLAAKAHISFAQLGGAISTMTAQGMTARQATQDLSHTISSLSNPTTVQTNEMAQLGLKSQTVASQLGSRGLTGTISELSGAITSHMGKSGTVIMSAFNQSTSAAQDANIMLGKLPPSIQGVAKAYLSGSASYTTFNNATKSVGLNARTLADQFATTAGKAHGFSSILTSGSPAAQTYTAALAKMTGGQTGLKTALMLTGKNAGTFASNVAAITKAGKGASTLTSGWAAIQGTFNQKMAVAKTGVENTGIAIGSSLLPAATTLLSMIGKIVIPIAEWTAKHKTLTAAIFIGITAIAGMIAIVALASKTFKAVKGAVNDVKSAYNGAITVMQKLGIISEQTAAKLKTNSNSAATTEKANAEKTAAVQEESAKKGAAAQEKAAGEGAAAQEKAAEEGAAAQEEAAGESAAASEAGATESADAYEWMKVQASFSATETAAANEGAAAESSASWIAAAGQQVAAAATWVAQSAVKVAGVVASNVAGAATTAGTWVAAAARQVAAGAMWVVQGVVKVLTYVATNVLGAETVSAAWLIASAAMLLGIGLVIAGVVIAVVEIVKHWKTISADIAKVWDTVYDYVSKIVRDVVNFVKAHWMLLLGVLLGPIALAVAAFITYRQRIVNVFEGLWHDVTGFFSNMWGDLERRVVTGVTNTLHTVEGWASDFWNLAGEVHQKVFGFIDGLWGDLERRVETGVKNTLHMVEGWGEDLWNLAGEVHQKVVAFIENMWGDLVRRTETGVSSIVHWFETLPGRVLAEVDKLATDLFTSGEHIIESLAHGIESAASGALHGAMSFVTNTIKSFLPFSPAKQGPLSGAGDPSFSGLSIAGKVATGLIQGTPQAAAAAAKMAGAIRSATTGSATAGIGSSLAGSAIAPAGGGANGGAPTIVIDVHGNTIMSNADIDLLVQKIGKRLATTTLPGSGRKTLIRG